MNDNEKKLDLSAAECCGCGAIGVPAVIVMDGNFFVCEACVEGTLPITHDRLVNMLIGAA